MLLAPVFLEMKKLLVLNGSTTTGNEASEGTYFYVVTYTTKTGETVTQKGNLTQKIHKFSTI